MGLIISCKVFVSCLQMDALFAAAFRVCVTSNHEHIVERFVDKEYIQFWKKIINRSCMLPDVPHLVDYYLAKESIKVYAADSLKFVPKELIDKPLCLIAVNICSFNLRFVPDELKDKDVCLAAVKRCGVSLMHVPKDLISDEMCHAAIKSSGYALKYVPIEMRSRELCNIAY